MTLSATLRKVRRFLHISRLGHDDIQDLCSDYVDGSLPPSLSGRFRQHLNTCENCNGFVATLRATVLTLRDLPKHAPPPELEGKIRERLAADAEGSTDILQAPQSPERPA